MLQADILNLGKGGVDHFREVLRVLSGIAGIGHHVPDIKGEG